MNRTILIAIALACSAMSSVPADIAKTGAIVPQVELTMGVIKDAGGLQPAKAPDGPLNVQLTHGLAKYIVGHDFGQIYLTTPGLRTTGPRPKEGVQVFDLEGDLSHTQVDDATGGPYLCILRLFKVGSDRTLVNQWAASAATYSDLAANLHVAAAASAEGLVGGLGDRIIRATLAATHEDPTAKFAALVAAGQVLRGIAASVIIEGVPQVSPVAPVLHSGDRYRINVTSEDAGSVYLVSIDSKGTPTSVFVPDSGGEIDVDSGRSALVPAGAPLPTGLVLTPTNLTLVVLVRRNVSSGSPIVQVSGASQEMGQPVTILDVGPEPGAKAAGPDEGINRIIEMAAKDPAGTWVTDTIVVPIEPAQTPAPH